MRSSPRTLVAVALVAVLAGCTIETGGGGPELARQAPPSVAPSAPVPTDTPAPAPQDPAAGTFGAIPDIVAEVGPEVVAVLTDGGQGSGVIYNSDGLVVTNNHVIENTSDVQIAYADGQRAPAQVVAATADYDLAVLQSERAGLTPAVFAPAQPRVGELAVAIGSPLGFEGSATAGIVSGLNRAVPGSVLQGSRALVDLIQTDAAISPGNSGGALVNGQRQVIGINVAYLPPGETGAVSIGFAIPSPTVIDVVEQLRSSGEVRQPFLGISSQPISDEIANQFGLAATEGLVVLDVTFGAPAAEAGIEPGMVITAVQGQPTRQQEDLIGALRDFDPGQQVTVTVVDQGGEPRDIQVTLGERPQE